MARRITITVDDETAAFLEAESERTNVSMSELIRRALDWYYRLRGRRRTTGVEVHLSVWRRRIFGRRAGIAFDP